MIINIKEMLKNSLSINDCLFIHFCKTKDFDSFDNYRQKFGAFIGKERVLELINLDFLKLNDKNKSLTFSNINTTVKSSFIFENNSKTSSISWIEDWYNLFPKGVKSGGYPIRSGLTACKIKMNKFLKKYPKYTQEIIISATKMYINELMKVNYSYMQLAKYFIEKDGVSTLESYCEQVVSLVNEGQNVDVEVNKGYTDSFSTSIN